MDTMQDRLVRCRYRTESLHGHRLRKRGMPYRDVQAKTGYSYSYIRNLEVNADANPSIEMLSALAGVYKTTLEWLRDGNPNVDVWTSFQTTSAYAETSNPSVLPGKRIGAVLQYTIDQYPGHWSVNDLAHYMRVSPEDAHAYLDGERAEPDLIAWVSELTGVPTSWLHLGTYYDIPTYLSDVSWQPGDVRRILAIGLRARKAGILDELEGIVSVLEKQKGGG